MLSLASCSPQGIDKLYELLRTAKEMIEARQGILPKYALVYPRALELVIQGLMSRVSLNADEVNKIALKLRREVGGYYFNPLCFSVAVDKIAVIIEIFPADQANDERKSTMVEMVPRPVAFSGNRPLSPPDEELVVVG